MEEPHSLTAEDARDLREQGLHPQADSVVDSRALAAFCQVLLDGGAGTRECGDALPEGGDSDSDDSSH
jgi:hypothetical protein